MEGAYIPAFILTLLEVVATFLLVPGSVFTTPKPVSDGILVPWFDLDYVDEDAVYED